MSRQGIFRRRRGHRYWVAGATLVAVAAFGVLFVASSGASLSTSPFEGSDGNMIVDTPGNTDWCTDFPAPASGTTCTTPIPGLRTLTDVPSGMSDNSFTQGSKEDNPTVTIAQGSIPPNKNDLTRAYAATQPIGNETFLYLAWERQPNPNGSANIDFELDQNATPGADWFTNGSSFTINRTEGDMLITYDFGGSGTPDLGLLTWLTTGNGHSNSDCEASGATLPCWGNRVDLTPGSTPAGESAVNSATIDEVFTGGQLSAGSFGEAKIDLSAVPGLFTPDTCTEFGSMFVKSRSSGSSIDAELKDFIAPIPFHLSNCASPTFTTATTVSSMTIGDTQTVGDTATLSGGDNPTGDVSFQLYSDQGCQNAVAGVSGTAALDNNGVASFSGASFTPDHAGTYYWGVSYAGDNHNNPASACGGDNEEIVVSPASPQVTTVANPSSAVIGADALTSVSDTATFTGGYQLDGQDATFTLYTDSLCSHATSVTGTAPISGGSATFTGDASGLGVGTYYWGVSYAGDSNNNPISECGGGEGITNEVLTIEKASPNVSTTADPSQVIVGSDGSSAVSDTATFTDGYQLSGDSVDFTLYSDQACQNATSVTGSAPIGDSNQATFTGDASSLPAGTYYWGVSFSGDGSNNAISECGGGEGVQNEVLTIQPASPQVTTMADPSQAVVGSDAAKTVSDTATFTGGFQLGGQSATFTLYNDPSCDPDNATSVSGSATIEDSAATFTGDASSLPAGTYYWGVNYAGDSNNNPVSECGGDEGVQNEVLTIGPASPTIATTLSTSAGNVGATVHDTAKLTGATAEAGGTVTYTVYSDNECSTKVAAGGTVNVSAGQVPNSNAITFNTPGTYYWQASYSGDGNNQAALSKCTDEQLVIAPLIDLAVTKVGSPNPITLGSGDITWTMAVTNNGPDTATGVKVSDPLPDGTTFVSVKTTQGTCTGGAMISCDLGTMAAGASVTITLVTTPTRTGPVTNTVTVVGNETETNTANNTATATVEVKGPFTPVYCVAVSKITPKQLFVGRKTGLTIHLTKNKQAAKGFRVRIKGAKLNITTKRSNGKGIIKQTIKAKKAGILVFTPIVAKPNTHCNTKRIGITGVFTPPVTG